MGTYASRRWLAEAPVTSCRALPEHLWLCCSHLLRPLPLLLAAALLAPTPAARGQELARRRSPLQLHAALAEGLDVPRLLDSGMGPRISARTDSVWAALAHRVEMRRRVGVWVADGLPVKGNLLAIDDSSILVAQLHGPRLVRVGEVTRVRYLTHRTAIVVLSFMAVGAATGYAATASDPINRGDAVVMTPLFFGLPVGLVVARLVREPDLYRSPRRAAVPPQ